MHTTDLSTYNNSDFEPGAGIIKRTLWYFTNAFFFKSSLFPFNSLKIFLLKIFGTKAGKGIIIKPCVNIKYPWKLQMADYLWIGENVWIDNLAEVRLGSHVCLSQGAMLLCGNHNYKKAGFDLMTGEIVLENGVWIAAKAVVTGGVHCGTHSILTVNSVISNNLEPYGIYTGNPAQKVKTRKTD